MQHNLTVGRNNINNTTVTPETSSSFRRELSGISNTTSDINASISEDEFETESVTKNPIDSKCDRNESTTKPKNHKPVYDSRKFDSDFESIIRQISKGNKNPSSFSKLPSCAQGIDDLEHSSIQKISSVLTGRIKEDFINIQEIGFGIPEFHMTFERFVICLSALDEGDLKNNLKKINELIEDLNKIFKFKKKGSLKYERMEDSFITKLDKFLSGYLKSGKKDLGEILKNNFKDNVFSGEIAQKIGSLYAKNNNIDDVFNDNLDGYIETTKERIKYFNHKNPSLDLEKLLRTNFAFRTILKSGNENTKKPESNENTNSGEKKPAESGNKPDSDRAKGHGNKSVFVNQNGIMANGENNTITVNNYYYSSGFPMDKFVSVTNYLRESKFSDRLISIDSIPFDNNPSLHQAAQSNYQRDIISSIEPKQVFMEQVFTVEKISNNHSAGSMKDNIQDDDTFIKKDNYKEIPLVRSTNKKKVKFLQLSDDKRAFRTIKTESSVSSLDDARKLLQYYQVLTHNKSFISDNQDSSIEDFRKTVGDFIPNESNNIRNSIVKPLEIKPESSTSDSTSTLSDIQPLMQSVQKVNSKKNVNNPAVLLTKQIKKRIEKFLPDIKENLSLIKIKRQEE